MKYYSGVPFLALNIRYPADDISDRDKSICVFGSYIEQGDLLVLKTVFPSSKFTKKYLGGSVK
ncbi:MAG: hypothetical protein JSR33_06825 [Proteobacteria bacterium]|nr:hypothetical protein [Pseudomonadota bacterium]